MNIIILDDSLTIRMIIESYLEDLDVQESEIFSFDNGKDALSFINKNGADIVFSDINMPFMSGYEFAKKLFLKHPKLKKSIFAISGDEKRENFLKMKKVGVHRFIKKPISMRYFTHYVKPEIQKRRA